MKPLSSNKLLSVIIVGAFIFVWALNSCKDTTNTPSPPKIVLSSELPTHNIDYNQSVANIQSQFDTEMWQTFVALCSPADGLQPITKGQITDQKDARAVFENYSFNYDLFLLNLVSDTDFAAVGWGQPDSIDLQRRARWNASDYCPDLVAQAEAKGITNMATLLPLDEFIEASNSKRPHVPVVDQNKNYVRTGVVYNKATFDWVVANQLHLPTGVIAAESHLTRQEVTQFVNNVKTTFYQMVNELETPIGAIQLKTSWKILGNGDDPSKFHTAWAAALFENYNFAYSSQVAPQCSLVQVGLVGMHIAKKTETQPDYIWATFEHIDNCPEQGNIQDKHYSFYNYANRDSMRNQLPKPNEDANDSLPPSDSPYKYPYWFNPAGTPIQPSQVVREIPIAAGTQSVNSSYQQALANTVWANYQLVGTQWADPKGKIIPTLLSNTTLETFEQPNASCYGCHHQLQPNTFSGTINDTQYVMGNVLNLKIDLQNQSQDTAVYSDFMWSLLKWNQGGHLTWGQIRED